MRTVSRKEDMSPDGEFRLHRQDDGDYVLTVVEGDDNGGVSAVASYEFTTPICGGGGSPATWEALGQLFEAMKKDHKEGLEHRRGRLNQ